MNKHLLSFIVMTLFSIPALGAFEDLELGIECQAMGGTGVVAAGLQGILWNPASTAFLETPAASAAGRLPYGLADFTTAGADFAMPLKGGWALGAGIRWFGGDLYSEQILHLTASRALSGSFAVGVQPVFSRASIADGAQSYGSAWTADLSVGLSASVYDRWTLGACLRNPFEARIGDGGEHLENRMDIGVRFEPVAGMASAFTVSRDYRGTRLLVGQSLPLGPMTLFAGARSGPASVTGGFSARVSGVEFSYAVETHSELNPTHQAGVGYAF